MHPGLSKLIDEVFPWRKRNINTKSISWPALWWSPAIALPLPSPPCCWWHCPEPGLDGNEKVSWRRCNHSGWCNHKNHHAANQLDLVVIIILSHCHFSLVDLIVVIVNNIAGGDLLQIRVETLVREQEERVTESATWWWEWLFMHIDIENVIFHDLEANEDLLKKTWNWTLVSLTSPAHPLCLVFNWISIYWAFLWLSVSLNLPLFFVRSTRVTFPAPNICFLLNLLFRQNVFLLQSLYSVLSFSVCSSFYFFLFSFSFPILPFLNIFSSATCKKGKCYQQRTLSKTDKTASSINNWIYRLALEGWAPSALTSLHCDNQPWVRLYHIILKPRSEEASDIKSNIKMKRNSM